MSMDSDEATLILTRELVKLGHVNIFSPEVMQHYLALVKNSSEHHALHRPQRSADGESNDFRWSDDDTNYAKSKAYPDATPLEERLGKMEEANTARLHAIAQEQHANYLFFDARQTVIADYRLRYDCSAVAYSIITDHEIEILRERFYKDVPYDILRAMHGLMIQDYIDEFEMYRQDTATWEKNLRKWFGSINNWQQGRHAKDYMRFSLTLPEADRNPEADALVFTRFESEFRCDELLLGLYKRKDTRFSGFAQLVGKKTLDNCVALVRCIQEEEQDSTLNTFLFEKGYRDLRVEPLDFYHADAPARFMEYFDTQPEEKKEGIIRMLISLDFSERNAAVDALLEKDHHELLERVGVSYVKEHDEQ